MQAEIGYLPSGEIQVSSDFTKVPGYSVTGSFVFTSHFFTTTSISEANKIHDVISHVFTVLSFEPEISHLSSDDTANVVTLSGCPVGIIISISRYLQGNAIINIKNRIKFFIRGVFFKGMKA